MLTLLAVFHIKITDGHLSGFVLISQMVTLQFPGLGYSSWIPVCSGSILAEIWSIPDHSVQYLEPQFPQS